MTARDVVAAALKLDLKQRAELAHKLLRSLDELSDEENEKLWAEEADRRAKELREGRSKEIPGHRVLAHARARLR